MANENPYGGGTYLTLLFIFLAGYFGYQFLNGQPLIPTVQTQESSKINHSFLTDNQLVYTKHAKCRMECREITKSEVNQILEKGKINWKKTREDDKPCPSYALEGVTNDGQTVRIVFADCNNATKVVTTIDLNNEYDCYCP